MVKQIFTAWSPASETQNNKATAIQKYNIKALTKRPPLCRREFQMLYLEWKWAYPCSLKCVRKCAINNKLPEPIMPLLNNAIADAPWGYYFTLSQYVTMT